MATSTTRDGAGRGRKTTPARGRVRAPAGRHDSALVERFYGLLSVIYRHISVGPLDVWEDLELTKAQLRTLVLLSEGPDRMTSIAARLGISLPAATGLIDRLVAKGLVERERDPEDRRAVVCRVAPTGTEALARLHEMGRDEVLQVVAHLAPAELERVVEGVEILAAAIEETSEDQPAELPAS